MDYNLNLIIQGILSVTRMIIDIMIVWFVLYYTIKIIRNNSRTIQIFKGVVLIIIVDFIAKIFGLNTVSFIASNFVNWGFLVIVIIFQPEIRNVLEKIGKSNVLSASSTLSSNEKERVITELAKTCIVLSKQQIGALISIENGQSLSEYVKTGVVLNSDLSSELLTSLFVSTTPLHDGAVILKGDKIICASAYFPPTNLKLSSKYGARHRAAIGISEISDCITLVVSEETGEISITQNGNLQLMNEDNLAEELNRLLYNAGSDDKKNNEFESNVYIVESSNIEIVDNNDKKKDDIIEASEEIIIKSPKSNERKGFFSFNKKKKSNKINIETEKIKEDILVNDKDETLNNDSLAKDEDFKAIIASLEESPKSKEE